MLLAIFGLRVRHCGDYRDAEALEDSGVVVDVAGALLGREIAVPRADANHTGAWFANITSNASSRSSRTGTRSRADSQQRGAKPTPKHFALEMEQRVRLLRQLGL